MKAPDPHPLLRTCQLAFTNEPTAAALILRSIADQLDAPGDGPTADGFCFRGRTRRLKPTPHTVLTHLWAARRRTLQVEWVEGEVWRNAPPHALRGALADINAMLAAIEHPQRIVRHAGLLSWA